jgi:hypothetical protein
MITRSQTVLRLRSRFLSSGSGLRPSISCGCIGLSEPAQIIRDLGANNWRILRGESHLNEHTDRSGACWFVRLSFTPFVNRKLQVVRNTKGRHRIFASRGTTSPFRVYLFY